eukprot:jgi/Botrbrau1/17486/Bobra.0054s0069.1
MNCSGVDSEGLETYVNPEQLWKEVEDDKENSWYRPAVEFWDKQEASYNGVLGGFGYVSDADISESTKFLKKAFGKALAEGAQGRHRIVAADCGAGVGRITERLLLHHFHEVDLVEPSGHLLEKARAKLSRPLQGIPPDHKAVNFFKIGLQSFCPEPGRYDLLWIQWVLLYLTDADAKAFFRRCAAALKPEGIIVVKENICKEGFIVDKEDTSLTRSHAYLLQLFDEAGMEVVCNKRQRDFPKGLFEVRMYALRPRKYA